MACVYIPHPVFMSTTLNIPLVKYLTENSVYEPLRKVCIARSGDAGRKNVSFVQIHESLWLTKSVVGARNFASMCSNEISCNFTVFSVQCSPYNVIFQFSPGQTTTYCKSNG